MQRKDIDDWNRAAVSICWHLPSEGHDQMWAGHRPVRLQGGFWPERSEPSKLQNRTVTLGGRTGLFWHYSETCMLDRLINPPSVAAIGTVSRMLGGASARGSH